MPRVSRQATTPSASATSKARRLQELVRGPTGRGAEQEILALLEGCKGKELDRVLSAVDLSALVSSVDDRLVGPDNRQRLFELLCRERVADLSIATRAGLIVACQAGATDAADERAIRDLFLSTHGRELTRLKNTLDRGGSYRDLHQLVFRDIDSAPLRREILAHLAREAPSTPGRELKVLSDIDDTLYCNWVDERYPKKAVYPGVLQFYKELDASFGSESGDLAFLTARPGDRAGFVEELTRGTLRQNGIPQAVILTGDVPSLVGNERIAAKKAQTLEQYHALYPEYRFVFIGDSGQGDALVGRAARAELGPVFPGAFIHDVKATPAAERARAVAQGVFFFDTYAGAALAAHRQGLLDVSALGRVARACVRDFQALRFSSAAQKQAAAAQLRAELDQVNSVLPAGRRVAFP